MKTVATHSGKFHPDDVFAVAVLKLIYPNIQVIRTRDEEVLTTADCRVDVGNKYSSDTLDFDHHQVGGAATRENGIPYASAGLVWKHFGLELVSNEDILNSIDKKLFQPIDADDNGIKIYETSFDCSPYTLAQILHNLFMPLWNEKNPDYDAIFLEAVSFAMNIIQKEIRLAEEKYKAKQEVLEAIIDPQAPYVVLKRFAPYQKIIRENSQAQFVVFQGENDEWVIRGINIGEDSFDIRKDLPKSWAGLRGEELEKASGVEGAIFCHNNLFFACAKTYEGAIALVELAIKE